MTSLVDARADMELALRRFTVLTVGDRIVLPRVGAAAGGGDGGGHAFEVTQLRPAPAAVLVNSDCEVEFQAPSGVRGGSLLGADLGAGGVGAGGGGGGGAPLRPGDIRTGEVARGSWAHFVLLVPEASGADTGGGAALLVDVECCAGGDADVYAAVADAPPSQLSADWADARAGAVKRLVLPLGDVRLMRAPRAVLGGDRDSGLRVRLVRVGVVGYAPGVSAFRLAVSVVPLSAAAAGAGAAVGVGGASWEGAPLPEAPLADGAVRCGTCGRGIPAGAMASHSAFCARHMTRCGKCSVLLRGAAERDDHAHCAVCGDVIAGGAAGAAKHADLAHGPVSCPACGVVVTVDALPMHAEVDCHLRARACLYCNASLPVHALLAHEEFCGARTEPCNVCRRLIPRRELELHVAGCVGTPGAVSPWTPPQGAVRTRRRQQQKQQRGRGGRDGGAPDRVGGGVATPAAEWGLMTDEDEEDAALAAALAASLAVGGAGACPDCGAECGAGARALATHVTGGCLAARAEDDMEIVELPGHIATAAEHAAVVAAAGSATPSHLAAAAVAWTVHAPPRGPAAVDAGASWEAEDAPVECPSCLEAHSTIEELHVHMLTTCAYKESNGEHLFAPNE